MRHLIFSPHIEWCFAGERSCVINDIYMIWVILYLPVAAYLSYVFTSHLELLSWSIVFAVILGFSIVEWMMVRKDHSRPKTILLIICLTLVSLLGGMLFR